jgi:hypothetical protein
MISAPLLTTGLFCFPLHRTCAGLFPSALFSLFCSPSTTSSQWISLCPFGGATAFVCSSLLPVQSPLTSFVVLHAQSVMHDGSDRRRGRGCGGACQGSQLELQRVKVHAEVRTAVRKPHLPIRTVHPQPPSAPLSNSCVYLSASHCILLVCAAFGCYYYIYI